MKFFQYKKMCRPLLVRCRKNFEKIFFFVLQLGYHTQQQFNSSMPCPQGFCFRPDTRRRRQRHAVPLAPRHKYVAKRCTMYF